MTLAKDKPQFDLKRVFALCFAVYAVLITGEILLPKQSGEYLLILADTGTVTDGRQRPISKNSMKCSLNTPLKRIPREF